MTVLQFVLCFIPLLFAIITASPPKLLPFNNHYNLVENITFPLTCSLLSDGGQSTSFIWTSNGVQLKNSSDYQIELGSSSKFSLLTIRNVQRGHAGLYECRAVNRFNEADVTKTQINVQVPPSWIKEPSDVNLRVGEDVAVECLADGLPKPTIKWITPSGRSIEGEVLDLGKIISSEKQHHGGGRSHHQQNHHGLSFECVAENGVGEALRKTVTVSYNVPAKIEEKYSSLTVKRGEAVVLRCNATGDRPLSVRWSNKDGAKIDHTTEHRYEIEEIPTPKGLLSELSIRSVTKADASIFKCDAENAHGRDDRTVKLAVVEEPAPPANVKINEVWSRSASISWRPAYNGNLPISRYVVQYWRKSMSSSASASGSASFASAGGHRLHEFNVSSSQTSALVKGLSPGLSYEMCVVAENDVGRSEPSETVPLYTGEEEPTGFPLDITVDPLGPTTVRITWRAPPRESWNGQLKGYYVGFRRARDGASTAYTLKSVDAGTSKGSSSHHQGSHHDPISIEAEEHEYFLRDLAKGTEYEIVLKAYNLAGSGPQSHVLLARTPEGDQPAAQHLVATDATASSITLRWSTKDPVRNADSQSTLISSYTLHYQREGEPRWREIPLSSQLATATPTTSESTYNPSYTYTLGNLESGVHYRIFVTAVNRYGFSDPSNIVFPKTAGERLLLAGAGPVGSSSGNNMYHFYDQNSMQQQPYYLQPEFTIPILTAFVIVFVISIFAYVCVRRAKQRAATATSLFVDGATLSKQFTGYSTTARFHDFDKVSGKPLIMTESGNIFPTPYATMPMDDNPQWDRQGMKKADHSHIYDAPQ